MVIDDRLEWMFEEINLLLPFPSSAPPYVCPTINLIILIYSFPYLSIPPLPYLPFSPGMMEGAREGKEWRERRNVSSYFFLPFPRLDISLLPLQFLPPCLRFSSYFFSSIPSPSVPRPPPPLSLSRRDPERSLVLGCRRVCKSFEQKSAKHSLAQMVSSS